VRALFHLRCFPRGWNVAPCGFQAVAAVFCQRGGSGREIIGQYGAAIASNFMLLKS